MNNFIEIYHTDDAEITDELIDLFNSNPDKHRVGMCAGTYGKMLINKSIKDSTDISVPVEIITQTKYFKELTRCVDLYIEKYSMVKEQDPWGLIEDVNIQRYEPNQGYHKWHCERSGADFPASARHLVFMTYLNDMNDDGHGGETEFLYQNMKIFPKKGMTVIWPADWTYTHRGIMSTTQTKLIVTGWLNFIPKYENRN